MCVRSHTDTHSHHDIHINTMGRVPHGGGGNSAVSGNRTVSDTVTVEFRFRIPTCLSINLLLSDILNSRSGDSARLAFTRERFRSKVRCVRTRTAVRLRMEESTTEMIRDHAMKLKDRRDGTAQESSSEGYRRQPGVSTRPSEAR